MEYITGGSKKYNKTFHLLLLDDRCCRLPADIQTNQHSPVMKMIRKLNLWIKSLRSDVHRYRIKLVRLPQLVSPSSVVSAAVWC